jgi:natural product precursor
MKKFDGKLKFNKEVVSVLSNSELKKLNGGLNDADASRIRCTGDLTTCDPCASTGALVCKTIMVGNKCIGIF